MKVGKLSMKFSRMASFEDQGILCCIPRSNNVADPNVDNTSKTARVHCRECRKRTDAMRNAIYTTGRACVKTSLKMSVEKIDRRESRLGNDHRPAKGLRYPIFGVARKFLEFSHSLIWTPPVCQVDFSVMPQRSTGCSLISGLVVQAEACGP
jgi:hypothetical protein